MMSRIQIDLRTFLLLCSQVSSRIWNVMLFLSTGNVQVVVNGSIYIVYPLKPIKFSSTSPEVFFSIN